MLWRELPSSLVGTEQQAQSSALQWAPFCGAVWSLLSLEAGKVQNAPQERDGSTNPKSRKNTGLWRNSWLSGGNSTKPVQELPGSRAEVVMIPLLIFSSLKKHYFFSNHMDVYLEEQRIMLNASSSAGRNLPDNGLAHIYPAWHPHVVLQRLRTMFLWGYMQAWKPFPLQTHNPDTTGVLTFSNWNDGV